MMNFGTTMKVVAVANNPIFFPAKAAFFHSTPPLFRKKRVYWPERSYRRWPPRPKYVFVFERFQVIGLDDPSYPTLDERTEYFSKKSSYSRRSFEKAFPNMSAARDERLALGLPAAGPLNLEDVKIAYRSCALKWHPDHHHNSSKAFAEEKFKNCNKAYQSLCHQLSSS